MRDSNIAYLVSRGQEPIDTHTRYQAILEEEERKRKFNRGFNTSYIDVQEQALGFGNQEYPIVRTPVGS